jgi:multidrug efflux pump subunit AcrB
MRLIHFFIRRSTATTLMIAAIAGFGLLSYISLPVSNLPEVEYPTIRVNAGLPGANPDVMASTVATPLESEFSMVPGVANMTSSSQTGETNIVLQFELNRSIDAAAQDVQAAIARAAGALPASMPSPPSYSKVNPAADPILWLEMSSTTLALDDFAKYADQVFAKRIAMVNGVSQVPAWGPSQPAIRVQADPAKLAAYGLSLEQIRAALATNSVNLPSGTLYGDARDYSLQANSQLTTAAEFSQLIVAYRGGVPLRLNQVADVFDSSRDDKSTFWINGRPSAWDCGGRWAFSVAVPDSLCHPSDLSLPASVPARANRMEPCKLHRGTGETGDHNLRLIANVLAFSSILIGQHSISFPKGAIRSSPPAVP